MTPEMQEELCEIARRMAAELQSVLDDAREAGSDQPQIRRLLNSYGDWVSREESPMAAIKEAAAHENLKGTLLENL